MATLPVVWRYRVNAGNGWPGAFKLSRGETAGFTFNLVSRCDRTVIPEIPLACGWDAKQTRINKAKTNKQQTNK